VKFLAFRKLRPRSWGTNTLLVHQPKSWGTSLPRSLRLLRLCRCGLFDGGKKVWRKKTLHEWCCTTVAVTDEAPGPASQSESTAETSAASPAETSTETATATGVNLDEDRERAFEVALNKRRLEHIPSLPDLSRAQAGPNDYDTDLEVMSCYSAEQGSSDHGSPRHSYRRKILSSID